jgi:hypothetical protein
MRYLGDLPLLSPTFPFIPLAARFTRSARRFALPACAPSRVIILYLYIINYYEEK